VQHVEVFDSTLKVRRIHERAEHCNLGKLSIYAFSKMVPEETSHRARVR
jgi:hypothetical protein